MGGLFVIRGNLRGQPTFRRRVSLLVNVTIAGVVFAQFVYGCAEYLVAGLKAVSHQFPEGNQARNHSHQKVSLWLVLAVFLWFWPSFEMVWFLITDEKLL